MKTYKEQCNHWKTGKALRRESECKPKLSGWEAKETIGF